jgi:hypothetical protein
VKWAAHRRIVVLSQIRSWIDPLPQPFKSNLLHDNAARLFDSFLQSPAHR